MIRIYETEHFIEITDLEVKLKSVRKLEVLINQYPEELKLIDYEVRYGDITSISDENSTINSLIDMLETVTHATHTNYRVLFLKIKSEN